MAYMNADTGNKVGFRPYGSTNPQCAAQLSGLGQNHPFKPEAWALHAPDGSFLGVYEFNRPFDPWELYEADGLHGLAGLGAGEECVYLAADGVTVESIDPNSSLAECGANGGIWEVPPGTVAVPVAAAPAAAPGIPIGSRLTYQCTFTPTSNPLSASFYSVSNVIAAVVANLQSQWGISVISSSGSGTLTGTPTANLQVSLNQPYGQVSDIQNIISGAFYNAAGASVTASSIALTATGSGAAPTVIAPGGVAPAAPLNPNALETWVMNNAAWIGIGVLAMVALPPLIKKL
jgi:hypothetical protein